MVENEPTVFLNKLLSARKISPEAVARFQLRTVGCDPPGVALRSYPIDQAQVHISEVEGKGFYTVQEPIMDETEQSLYKLIMVYLYYSLKPATGVDDPVDYVRQFIGEAADEIGISEQVEASFDKLLYYIRRDSVGYHVVDVPIRDPGVEEVECGGANRPITVVHRDFTEFWRLQTNVLLSREEEVAAYVQKLAQKGGKSVTVALPFSDFMLPEGHRVAVTYSREISLPGSTFDIRKFPQAPLTIIHLLKSRTTSPLMAAYYWLIAENKGFTLITGAMSSGKTTVLNALLAMLHPSAKILTVEDTPELRIPQENWVRFVSRSSYVHGGRDIGLFDLVKVSLRYRPDYVVVGEVRGEEVQSLVQAAAVGHGALTTFHGESPRAAIVRMSSPPLNVGSSFMLLIWSFLQMAKTRTADGKEVRRAIAGVEIIPTYNEEEPYYLKSIFTWDSRGDRILPETPAEVVRTSGRLGLIGNMKGWTNDQLVEELGFRAHFLESLLRAGVYSYTEVSQQLHRFYTMNGRRQALPSPAS